MKLGAETLTILKNFAAINKHIIIKPGNVLRTVSPNKTILARATIEDEFPCEVPIYELNKLLNALGLFKDPDIHFSDHHLTISLGPSKLTFAYANPDPLIKPPVNDLVLKNVFETVTIPESVLQALDKARKSLGLEEICIESYDDDLWLKALDANGSTNNEFAINIGKSKENFRAIFEAEYLQVIPQDYEVQIDRRGITHWKGSGIDYWIVLSAKHSELEQREAA